ncbi:MAG: hypothetical protein U0641_04220 [Anaerolineae bacterium]
MLPLAALLRTQVTASSPAVATDSKSVAEWTKPGQAGSVGNDVV